MMAWVVARSHLLLLLLCACSQESFVLGGIADAGEPEPLDARPADAALWEDAAAPLEPSPMSVSVNVRGRAHVLGLAVGCGASCVEVRVEVAGGQPPYQITWDDGKKGAVRPLCADPERPRGGIVQDASFGVNPPVSFSLGVVEQLACDQWGSSYRTCFLPGPAVSDCADAGAYVLVVDLGRSFSATSVLSVEIVAQGRVPRGQAFAYGVSETCEHVSTLSGDYEYLDTAGEITRQRFEIGAELGARYLAFNGELFPLVLPDAGASIEVNSVVVCESTSDSAAAL